MAQDKNGSESTKVKVFLLAENRLLRETLVRLLEKKGGVSIAGVSRYTESAIEEIMASGCSILLMDSLATTQATTLICDLRELAPQLGVILFGMDEDPDAFLRSAYLGVSGYVLKEASASEMLPPFWVSRATKQCGLRGSAWRFFAISLRSTGPAPEFLSCPEARTTV